MAFRVDSIDHLVLTVRDIDATVSFYVGVLGMSRIDFNGRVAVKVSDQKINLHLAGEEIVPHASKPLPGSADLCFLTSLPVAAWIDHLATKGIPLERGPVPRTGATGEILSIYLRDPDQNLIEISNQI
jgi:catechol 2,3-dioxygenase-like lactoylglutathione lyase family enzyme